MDIVFDLGKKGGWFCLDGLRRDKVKGVLRSFFC